MPGGAIGDTVGQTALWIVDADESDVAVWMYRVLQGVRESVPAQLQRLTPHEVLVAVFRHSDAPELRNKLWAAVDRLARQASWRSGAVEYLAALLTVIGSLSVRPTYDLLVRLGNASLLKPSLLMSS